MSEVTSGLMGAMWAFFRRRSPRGDRSWNDVVLLIATLNAMADKWISGRDFRMLIHHGECQITLRWKGTEFSGKGADPWAAAEDLARRCGKLSTAISEALAPHKDTAKKEP